MTQRSRWSAHIKTQEANALGAEEYSMHHIRQSMGYPSEIEPVSKKKLAFLLPSRRGGRSSPSLQRSHTDRFQSPPNETGMIFG